MNGFDSEFKNLKDFILKITYRIWEERGVERIRDYYGEKALVKTPTSVSDNVEDVIKKKPKVIWLQEGIHNSEAEELARSNGIMVIFNRCMLAEHQRLF